MELCAVLAALGLLAAVALPVLANPKLLSERLTCLSNLRQIGHAFQVWGNDHGDLPPWWVPAVEGGMQPPFTPPALPIPGSILSRLYFHFLWLSNELSTPKILVCPSDLKKKVALTWSRRPDGGLDNAAYQDNGVSYFISLHAKADYPQALLCGDRNVFTNGLSGCSAFTNVSATVSLIDSQFVPPSTDWVPGLHGNTGNLLFNDGQVKQVSRTGLHQVLRDTPSEYGAWHFLFP